MFAKKSYFQIKTCRLSQVTNFFGLNFTKFYFLSEGKKRFRPAYEIIPGCWEPRSPKAASSSSANAISAVNSFLNLLFRLDTKFFRLPMLGGSMASWNQKIKLGPTN